MEGKLITSKKTGIWRLEVYRKYVDVFRIPQIYQQYYDLSEYEYIRKEVEELYREDMLFSVIVGRFEV